MTSRRTPPPTAVVTPSVTRAIAVAVAWELDVYEPAFGMFVAVAVFGGRILALRRHWHGPRAVRRPVR